MLTLQYLVRHFSHSGEKSNGRTEKTKWAKSEKNTIMNTVKATDSEEQKPWIVNDTHHEPAGKNGPIFYYYFSAKNNTDPFQMIIQVLRGEKYINEVVGVVEHLHLKLGTQLMHKLEKPKI